MTPKKPGNPWEDAIELTKDAMAASDGGEHKKAEKLLKKAMELVPEEETFTNNYVEYCLQVGHNCALEEDHKQAVFFLKKALEQSPNDAEGWMDLGSEYAKCNLPVEALEAWQTALDLFNPKRPRDKHNIEDILENIRMVQDGLLAAGLKDD
jgi:tetratricopeptide (TPR) repeat protein